MSKACCLLLPVALWAGTASADHGCIPMVGPVCEVHYVEKTVYEPCWVTELRTVTCTEWKTELRERRFTVVKNVPETHQVTQQYTVIVPKEESKIVKYRVSVPVVRDVEKKYTVMVPVARDVQKDYFVQVPIWENVQRQYTVVVPHQELRTATRTVCRDVPSLEKRLITRDLGHFATACHDVATTCCSCRSCNPCCTTTLTPVCKKIWVPNVVQEEIDVTVCRKECANEQFQYSVTVCKPETRVETVKVQKLVTEKRSETVRVHDLVPEQRTEVVKVHDCVVEEREKEVKYIVNVPETHSKTVDVVKYVQVPEERVETVQVKVPVTIEKQVEVKVCKMVPKCVLVPVTKCCGPAHCGVVRKCCY